MSLRRKSSPPPTPQLPQQPKEEELMDFIDEIAGTQSITTIGPDGRKKRITQRILTPQEKALIGKAENLMNMAVNNIETLYKYDPAAIVDYQPFIQAFSRINNERMNELSRIGDFADIANKVENFRQLNNEIVNRNLVASERRMEYDLARSGRAGGSYAAAARAEFEREKALAKQQADVTANMYGEDLAMRQLGREKEIFGLNEAQRQAQLQEAQLGYDLEKQKLADAELLRQNAIQENMNLLGIGQNIKAAENDKAKLASYNNQIANQMFATQAQNSNQRYLNEMGRIQNQYGMDLARYNSTPASFGQKLTDVGLKALGDYIGAKTGGGISTLANKFGNSSENTSSNYSNWVNSNFTNTSGRRMTANFGDIYRPRS